MGAGAMGTGSVILPALRNWNVNGVLRPARKGWLVVSNTRSSPTTSGLVGPAPVVLVTVVPPGIWVVPSTAALLAIGLLTVINESGSLPWLMIVSNTGTVDPAG